MKILNKKGTTNSNYVEVIVFIIGFVLGIYFARYFPNIFEMMGLKFV